MTTELTYPQVGATRTGRLPAGYRHLRHRTRIGAGEAVFTRAGEAVMTFRMHRAIGARIRAEQDRAAPGVRLTQSMGPLRVPCQVVWAEQDRRRIGFGYGTRAGHQASGEEAFIVERDDQDRVWFTVIAFSRPARLPMLLAGPLGMLFQRLYARQCGRALRKLSTVAT